MLLLLFFRLQKSENIDITEFLFIIKHLLKSNANPELLLLNTVLGEISVSCFFFFYTFILRVR